MAGSPRPFAGAAKSKVAKESRAAQNDDAAEKPWRMCTEPTCVGR
jgi:hypothetical protein